MNLKDMDGNGYDLNKVLSWHLPAVTEENCKKTLVRIAGIQPTFELSTT
jgi:hypothetical protein